MSRCYRINVVGEVQPECKRQRFNKRRDGTRVPGARTDAPDRASWKAHVALKAAEVCDKLLEGPLYVDIVVLKPRPPSYPNRPTKGCPWPWHWTKKPDTDNLEKPVKDALTGIAWLDDAQVIDAATHKRFGRRHEVWITVVQVTDLCMMPPREVQDAWEWIAAREAERDAS